MAYTKNPDILSTRLDDEESVLLNIRTRKYFTINETGSLIWDCLEDGKSFDEMVVAVTSAFDIESEAAAMHVERFLGKLEQGGIIRRTDDSNS